MIAWVDSLLLRWGRWASSSRHLGYPNVSPMFRDSPPDGGNRYQYDPGYTERDLLACDQAIKCLPSVLRVVVIDHYQIGGGIVNTCRLTGISARTVKRYLSDAQSQIALNMDCK